MVERRKFKRLHAPVLCRPLGAALVKPQEEVADISLGGVRVYTDDRHQMGEHLELELFMPSGDTLTLDTVVAWIEELEVTGPARFELGLRFVDVSPETEAQLAAVLRED